MTKPDFKDMSNKENEVFEQAIQSIEDLSPKNREKLLLLILEKRLNKKNLEKFDCKDMSNKEKKAFEQAIQSIKCLSSENQEKLLLSILKQQLTKQNIEKEELVKTALALLEKTDQDKLLDKIYKIKEQAIADYLDALELSYRIFYDNFRELQSYLKDEKTEKLFQESKTNPDQRINLTSKTLKFLQNFLSSGEALYDYIKAVKKDLHKNDNLPKKYHDKLKELDNNIIRDFCKRLRNYCLHFTVPDIWIQESLSSKYERKFDLVISVKSLEFVHEEIIETWNKESLQRWIKWRESLKKVIDYENKKIAQTSQFCTLAFLRDAEILGLLLCWLMFLQKRIIEDSNSIYISLLTEEYFTLISDFLNWFLGQLKEIHKADFENLIKSKQKLGRDYFPEEDDC